MTQSHTKSPITALPQRYRMRLSYDGADFSGWQTQPNATSIQETLVRALSLLLREHTRIRGAGRTDAGVHALEQTAHFTTTVEFEPKKLLRSLNGLLPFTIRVWDLVPVSRDFHAQYGAIGKIYHYHLTLGPVQSPFHRFTRWHMRRQLDIDLLRKATQGFIGTHDFSSFANQQHSGSAGRNAIRTITRLDVVEEEGGVRLEFEGNGFLYKMVRNIVGCLVEISNGKRPLSDIERLLQAKNRRLAGKAAPPHGLFLVKALYPDMTKEKSHEQ